MYVANLAFVLGALVVLGACGWWAVAPFRGQFTHSLAQAPLAGMILVPTATLGLMVGLSLELRWAAIVAIVALTAGSLATVRLGGVSLGARPLAPATAIVIGGAAVWFLTSADLFFGSPGLVYAHGTDHLGYADIADWLGRPLRNMKPPPTPDDWYGAWAQSIYGFEPRFGSFAYLALVSLFSGRSGAFAYDLGCAVVLAAGSLGVAGAFAQRGVTFVVLTVGLFTSFWFDWSRAGYLGKMTAYPATILVAALLFAWMERARREGPGSLFPLATVAALTAGAALFFAGIVTALFLALLGSAFLAVTALAPTERESPPGGHGAADPLVALALLIALAMLSSGTLARPIFLVDRRPLSWSWSELLLRATEVDGLLAARTGLSPAMVWGLIFALLTMWAGLTVLAVLRRVPVAAATLIAPLVLLGGLLAADLRWQAMNFIGVYVPLLLCGAVALADAPVHRRSRPWTSWGVLALLVLTVASHLPRFAATAAFHGGADTPPMFRFSARETDALEAAIRREGGSALVDTEDAPHFPFFLMVELGHRGIPLQWTEQSWKAVFSLRAWPLPRYETRAPLRIVVRSPDGGRTGDHVIVRTTQFELLRQR